MANQDRIKRRVLQQAVEENLDTMRGLAPKSLRRPRRLVSVWGKRALLLVLPISLAGSTYIVANARLSQSSTAARAAIVPSPAVSSQHQLAMTTSFSKPSGIDPGVLALGVRRVVIDAGHGGTSPGTSTGTGVYEKEFTLDIATRLRALLEQQNFEVVMTRTGDQTLTLEERANLANQSKGDVFISIHLNWLKNPNNRGVETYYLGTTNDPHLNALAAEENRESGYSLADMRNLLEGIYADVRQDESKRLAEAVQQQLYSGLKQVNPQLRDRGVKTAPFVVLVTTGMPAILAEVSCLSNQAEAELLKQPAYRQKIAEALSSGIRTYATPRDLQQKGT